jgi:hypothetical protein
MLDQILPYGKKAPYEASHDMDGGVSLVLTVYKVVKNCYLSRMLSESVEFLGEKDCEHRLASGLPS